MLSIICILEDEIGIKRDEVICSRLQLESNGIGSAAGKKKEYIPEILHWVFAFNKKMEIDVF